MILISVCIIRMYRNRVSSVGAASMTEKSFSGFRKGQSILFACVPRSVPEYNVT